MSNLTWESTVSAYSSRFSYNVQVTVPSGYIVATGGTLKDTETEGDSITFFFESKVPSWRMDIAVARFKTIRYEAGGLVVYALPEDDQSAVRVLNAMTKVIRLYSTLFGKIKGYRGFTAIEIPDGWGSQASDYYFLQTAAAFRDTNKISEVYHEIAHTWTVNARRDVQRCRWFDEAFAMYFEALAIGEFRGDSDFQSHMDGLRERWIQRATKDRRNFDTPIADYAKEELGQNSYTKGAWSLYVLHQVVGDEGFSQTIRTLLRDFADKPADFTDFQSVAEHTTGRNLTTFFAEWIYGAQSSHLLAGKASIKEIVKRY